jgi:hypothetical protein
MSSTRPSGSKTTQSVARAGVRGKLMRGSSLGDDVKPEVDLEKDLIGIGAGPANLSLAALLTTARERGLTSITGNFFERTRCRCFQEPVEEDLQRLCKLPRLALSCAGPCTRACHQPKWTKFAAGQGSGLTVAEPSHQGRLISVCIQFLRPLPGNCAPAPGSRSRRGSSRLSDRAKTLADTRQGRFCSP